MQTAGHGQAAEHLHVLAAAAHALDWQARVTTACEAAARLGRERTKESRIARVSLAALLPDAEALDLGRDAFAEVAADARSDELPQLSEAAARLVPSVVRGLWAWSETLRPLGAALGPRAPRCGSARRGA
ncbi:hypothetical protein [Sorangium sp. So ce1099]|uniref:hypothetical protein n=1 Tax=Sorangium sp. So ce1099 TaxID=3133331 RepID=UPI003F5E557A